MRRLIVTNKDVITSEFNPNQGHITHTTFNYHGDQVIGKKQLIQMIQHEAEYRVRQKYLMKECEEILSEIVLVKPKLSEIKKIFKFVKFTDK